MISIKFCSKLFFGFRYNMDGEDDYCAYGRERKTNNGSRGVADLGDMSFMMLDYIKDAMKVHCWFLMYFFFTNSILINVRY